MTSSAPSSAAQHSSHELENEGGAAAEQGNGDKAAESDETVESEGEGDTARSRQEAFDGSDGTDSKAAVLPALVGYGSSSSDEDDSDEAEDTRPEYKQKFDSFF